MTNNKVWARIVLTAALASGLLLAVGGTARADNRGDCQRRLESDRAKIDRDAHRFGEHSRQVDRDVAKMDQNRQWCRDHKVDYDHDRFDVGIYLRR
jgi:hypothetical protein